MLLPLKLIRDQPLQQQLYDQLRQLIVSRRLAPGTRMPSTRMLAVQFSISRITVLLTYERLITEGFLRSEPARGTFVNHLPSADRGTVMRPARPAESLPAAAFDVGQPDPRLFPTSRWRTLIRHMLDDLGTLLHGQSPDDDPTLRRAIAGWLSGARGVAADPDQIILANDPRHALHIVAHLTLRPGQCATIEQPAPPDVGDLLASTGAAVITVPVDADGLCTDRLPAGPAALAVVSPENQLPLGMPLGQARRTALLAWAEHSGATIFEAVFDGDLRYAAEDSPALMMAGSGASVILGSGFAASLGPGTMRSYLVVPPGLVDQARTASRITGLASSVLENAALAHLLDDGGYARHLHSLRRTYQSRRDALIQALDTHLGGHLVAEPRAGLHLAWTCPTDADPATVTAAALRRRGLRACALDSQTLALGFGNHGERDIAAAVARAAADLARPTTMSAEACD